jgi:hypothetical protein
MAWIDFLARHEKRNQLLKRVEEWKKFVHPRVSEPLLAIITFYFEQLLRYAPRNHRSFLYGFSRNGHPAHDSRSCSFSRSAGID